MAIIGYNGGKKTQNNLVYATNSGKITKGAAGAQRKATKDGKKSVYS
ncbi:MAG: hypothetical protein MPJ24_11935 [Pirellulaceae bacterium]|nr:hypothetical protein [Pirellulaceae bacterium]